MEKLCTCLLFGVLVVNEVGVEGEGRGGSGSIYLSKWHIRMCSLP